VERRTTSIRPLAVAKAAAVFCAVGLPWYAAMTATHGMPYLESFFVADNLERFATDRFNAPRPAWFYPAVLAGGLFPWTVHGIGPLVGTAGTAVRGRLRLSASEIRLCLWAVMPLLLFMASVGQQPRYILPILPPLAILLANALTVRARAGARDLRATTWLLAGVFVALAAALLRLRPMLVAVPAAAPWIGATVLAGTGGALALAALVAANRRANEPVGTYQAFVRNLVFYTRFKHIELYDEGVALNFLKSPERVLLVTRARDLPRLQSIAGVSVRPIAQLQYLNAAGVRLRTVLSPLPEQDFETIVLVTNR
jgi:4-amino-4-deoxy-L-arabinose transferase-like glycosyltransferase